MKPRENATSKQKKPSSLAPFRGVKDSRGRPVKFLQTRLGRFYAALRVEGGDGVKKARRFPLVNEDGSPVRNLTEAGEALAKLRVDRVNDALPAAGRKPTFYAYAETYLSKASTMAKKKGTLENERNTLELWKSHLGSVPVDKITTPLIVSFQEKRLKGQLVVDGKQYKAVSARTANLDVVILRNVLNSALDDGYLRTVPRVKKLKEKEPVAKGLLSESELGALIAAAATACQRNGEQLADYLRFLAFSGAREQEALHIAWDDVNFGASRVLIGADGDTKNGKSRWVNFTAPLQSLLVEMRSRRDPNCRWLFPSPRRGEKDIHAASFKESLSLARAAAGLPWVGFHHLRHYFCSWCVMSGIDFMTIAAWVGHSDGGILIGKTYGHLADEHKKQAASRVSFGLRALPSLPRGIA